MTPPGPLFSVVIPVYNRQSELRRALASVANQSLTDFECLVVDDGSTEPIKPTVDEFDERFVYIRRDNNGGRTAARLTAYEHVTGDLVTILDSDNEYFAWTLDRSAYYLQKYPEADAVAGLYVFPDGLRVRIAGGERVTGPDVYARQSSPRPGFDSVQTVRRNVVQEWLQLRRDYFNLDLALLLSLLMSHLVVRVDEPWGRYHTDAADRITTRNDPKSLGLDDIPKFVGEFRPLLGQTPCGPLDVALVNMWTRLIRAHRYQEAAAVADWMRSRGISRWDAIRRKSNWVLRQRIAPLNRSRVRVV